MDEPLSVFRRQSQRRSLGWKERRGSFEEEVGRPGACVRRCLGSGGLVSPPGSVHPESSIPGAQWIIFTYMNPAVMDLFVFLFLISYLFLPHFPLCPSLAPFPFPFSLSPLTPCLVISSCFFPLPYRVSFSNLVCPGTHM